jgi:hypothetical protein
VTGRQQGRVVRMWEVRAAPGRLAELTAHVAGLLPPGARIYRSRPGDAEERLVVIDPGSGPVPDLPAGLVARRPHAWDFEQVQPAP